MSKKKRLDALVNCWFCNEDSRVKKENSNEWTCSKCSQYNGFTAEGDYNKEIPDQHDVKDLKTGTVCESGDFHCASPVLCAACSNNQALFVRQLATFKSMNEDSYDEELESYKKYLEEVYKLCPTCEDQVKECISEQNQLLQSKMSSAQQERLKAVDKEPSNILAGHEALQIRQLRAPCVPTLMFICCFLLAMVHAIICLRLYAVSNVSQVSSPKGRNANWVSHFMLWMVVVVPAGNALAAQEIVVYLGAAMCMAGLFSSGKYSLYLEDCIHLLLWLLKLLTWAEWIHVADGPVLALSLFTVSLALIACLRSRQPRRLSPLLFFRKDVNSLRPSKKACEVDESSQSEPTLPDIRESESSCSSVSSSSNQFEEVRQDLETFSIGLGKKSSSKSSIWSLPAVIASSLKPDSNPLTTGQSMSSEQMTPDSTTGDQAFPSRPGTPRSVLSPSRLGFLNFDSNSGSRCPSPWDPIMEIRSSPDLPPQEDGRLSPSRPGSTSQDMFYGAQVTSEARHHLSKDNRNQANFTADQGLWRRLDPSQGSSGSPDSYFLHSSLLSYPRSRDVTHLDQRQRPLPHQPQLFSLPAGTESGFPNQPNDQPQSEWRSPENSLLAEAQGVRRRSQRLANAKKLPKPWPLRKSLSCNNTVDIENVEKAGMAARFVRFHAPTPLSTQSVNKDFIHDPCLKQNLPYQSQYASVLPSNEKRNDHLLQYRDGGGPKLSNTLQPKRGFEFTSNLRDRKLHPDNTSSAGVKNDKSVLQSEFSDDEEMEVKESWINSKIRKPKARSSQVAGGDVYIRWILIGTLIGASVTCNIFLLLHTWLQR